MESIKYKKSFLVCIALSAILLSSCGDDSKEVFSQNVVEASQVKDELVVPDDTIFLGTDISNQPYIVVDKLIKNKNEELAESSFTVVGRNNTYSINYNDIDYRLDENAIVECIKNSDENNLVYTYNQEKLNEILNSIKKSENIIAQNAMIKRINGTFDITEGNNGSIIDETVLNEDISQILNLDKNESTLVFNETVPQYTSEAYSNFVLIGTYSTKYNINSTDRNKNLAQACNKINNTVLFPGEVFSTNEKFGETTIENGYAMSNIIVNNELVEGVGGGVCQISSTLYNAVLRAELPIVERVNHSLQVSYAPIGFDATLANPYIDFKFENNQDTPILVNAYIDRGKATVNIYGEEIHDSSRSLVFRSELVSTTEATTTYVDDNTIPKGQEVIKTTPLNGQVIDTYKDVYENGKLIETDYIARSTYATRNGVTQVGTKEPEVTTPQNPTSEQVEQESSEDNTQIQ